MQIVLNTFGITLGRDNEGFVITTQDNRQRIPISGVSSILVAKGALISSDAMLLAIENEIEVIIADKMGNPQGRIWTPRYGSISTIRKGQLVFTRSKDALEWIKELLTTKIKNQQATILSIKTQQDNKVDMLATKAISRLEEYINKIENLDADLLSDVVTQLRGWEGVSAKIYFGQGMVHSL